MTVTNNDLLKGAGLKTMLNYALLPYFYILIENQQTIPKFIVKLFISSEICGYKIRICLLMHHKYNVLQ